VQGLHADHIPFLAISSFQHASEFTSQPRREPTSFTAPEADCGIHQYQSDVFSLGQLFFLMLCGRPTWEYGRFNLDRIDEFVCFSSDWQSVFTILKGVVLQMLDFDYLVRPSMSNVLRTL
jgi:hypothetical protein